jgi:hypothetical protein
LALGEAIAGSSGRPERLRPHSKRRQSALVIKLELEAEFL